jgi:hypothetical protein
MKLTMAKIIARESQELFLESPGNKPHKWECKIVVNQTR